MINPADVLSKKPEKLSKGWGPARTTRTRNCVSRATFLGLAFKLIEEAGKSWRRIKGADRIELLLKGVPFKDGEAVLDNPSPQQELAA